MRRFTAILLAGGLVAGAVTWASAQCTTDDGASAARKTVKKAAKCNDKRLRSGPTATCTIDPPPACSGSLTVDAVALAYGPNNPPGAAAKALSDQRRCQRQIGKGVADFVGIMEHLRNLGIADNTIAVRGVAVTAGMIGQAVRHARSDRTRRRAVTQGRAGCRRRRPLSARP